MPHDFKEVTEILADQSIVLRQLVTCGPEPAATSHLVILYPFVTSLLQVYVSLKPEFQILPGIDFVVDRSIAVLDRLLGGDAAPRGLGLLCS